MSTSFNLTTEPWVPCERLDGSHVELSTLDALAQAHTLRAIDHASPLVLATLHRHLLAVLHRGYAGPKNMKEWAAIASAGRFDRGRIDAYLSSVRDRMDLFHPTHPFAQTRGLATQFEARPIDELEIERSGWGIARELFQHRPPGFQSTVTAAHAARALLAHHAFATGGTTARNPGDPCVSVTAAPLVGSALVVLRGPTLFGTLRANLLRYDAELIPIPCSGNDAPAWEQPPLPAELRASAEPERLPNGWLDVLTWLSRRVELIGDADGVTGWIRAVGQGVADGAALDPMVTYRADEKVGWRAMSLNAKRAFWRDAGALFEAARAGAPATFRRPLAIDLVASASALGVVASSDAYSVDVLGIAAFQSKVSMVRGDHVHVMARWFEDPTARDAIERSIALAEEVVKALGRALNSYARHALSPGERLPDNKDVYAFVDSTNARAACWSALGLAFDTFMRTMADGIDAAESGFAERALAIVTDEFNRAAARSETTARWLKARALGERSLRGSLATLPRPDSDATIPTTTNESSP